jgi:hypothetical protein
VKKMKNKTIKIAGIGVVGLIILIAFSPVALGLIPQFKTIDIDGHGITPENSNQQIQIQTKVIINGILKTVIISSPGGTLVAYYIFNLDPQDPLEGDWVPLGTTFYPREL